MVLVCGWLIVNGEDVCLVEVLVMGCWMLVEWFGFDLVLEWSVVLVYVDGSCFCVFYWGVDVGEV